MLPVCVHCMFNVCVCGQTCICHAVFVKVRGLFQEAVFSFHCAEAGAWLLGFILHVGWPLYHTSPLRCCGITGVCYHVQSFHMDSGDQTQTAKVCRANVS